MTFDSNKIKFRKIMFCNIYNLLFGAVFKILLNAIICLSMLIMQGIKNSVMCSSPQFPSKILEMNL